MSHFLHYPTIYSGLIFDLNSSKRKYLGFSGGVSYYGRFNHRDSEPWNNTNITVTAGPSWLFGGHKLQYRPSIQAGYQYTIPIPTAIIGELFTQHTQKFLLTSHTKLKEQNLGFMSLPAWVTALKAGTMSPYFIGITFNQIWPVLPLWLILASLLNTRSG